MIGIWCSMKLYSLERSLSHPAECRSIDIDQTGNMKERTRKLSGSIGLLFGLSAYIVACVNLADFVPRQFLLEMLFYALAGVGWAYPTIFLIRWMNKPDLPEDQ